MKGLLWKAHIYFLNIDNNGLEYAASAWTIVYQALIYTVIISMVRYAIVFYMLQNYHTKNIPVIALNHP